MRILLVAHLKRAIFPRQTASRSRIIYELARGLVARGHEVSILGTGDSRVSGVRIIPVLPKALVFSGPFENEFYSHTAYLAILTRRLAEIGDSFDVIHNHAYPEFFPLFALEHLKTPVLTTLHAQGTLEFDEALSTFPSAHFVALSRAHVKSFQKTKIAHVVPNGIDVNLFRFQKKKEDYLLWIGRLAKARDARGNFLDPKGVRWAIRLARETGARLVLSGNVEDREFFEKDVKPFLNKKIQWVGGVSSEQPLSKREVARLMGGARAFLMTINWAEPFGLVMAEAFSCGTPVIGFDRGAVKEIVADGKTGFVVSPRAGIAGLKRALSHVHEIHPEECRARAVALFSTERMVREYENIYKKLCA
ncbi:MAG: glycosyltransferase family 4 protein [Candidatus Wolfebacteria bacterium]|nr:glycosyltransferase family 4 protein [Candidatus Wolfebacteria bacterium]MDP2703869.1 glycosyltransferase family 4 protein [bacterium]